MRVWVNTADGGWIQHGGERTSAERAAAVARLQNRRLGWETASGLRPPEPRPAPSGAPTAAVAAVSPASFGDSHTPKARQTKAPEPDLRSLETSAIDGAET